MKSLIIKPVNTEHLSIPNITAGSKEVRFSSGFTLDLCQDETKGFLLTFNFLKTQ